MTIGLLDLSIVTDRIIKHLEDARDTTRLWGADPPPFTLKFTGLPPDGAKKLQESCKVSLYLFHVTPDKAYRNVFPADPTDGRRAATRPRQIPYQPFALTLYYLMSAHSESYIQEQQAMSIALKCLHEHPIITAAVPVGTRKQELTLTMEVETVDEISRLWQSMSSPLRLSAIYRASVVFLEPEEDTRPPVRTVIEDGYSVSAYPQFVVSRAQVSPTGRVTVWGRHFDDQRLEVRLEGATLATTTANPPPAGSVRVVTANELDFQLPSGTRKGLVRLGVTVSVEEVEAVFTIKVPDDVP